MTEIILAVGVLNGFVLGAVLFTLRNGRESATRLFGFILILIALIILENLLIVMGGHLTFPHLLRTTDGLILLLFPSIYLYSILVTEKGRVLDKSDLLHVVPFVLFTMGLIPYYTLDGEAKIRYTDSDNIILFGYLKAISGLVYFPLSLRRVIKFKRGIKKEELPNNNYDNINWFYRVLLTLCLIAIVSLLSFTLESLGSNRFTESDTLTSILLTATFYANGFVLIRNPFILWGTKEINYAQERLVQSEKASKRKYKNSPLTQAQQQEYLSLLISIMEKDEVYTNPVLSPLDLQQLSGIKSQYITEVLNVVLGQNFYEFVNAYRVEKLKGLIQNTDQEHKTLLGLGLEAGFNSKSSLNRIFKQFTGQTPSQFKKEVSKARLS